MKFVRLTVLMLLAVFVFGLTNANAAMVRITQPKLISLKISITKFGIMNISKDGNIVTGFEKVADTKLKQKGTVYKLWVFDFSGKTRDSLKVTEVLLPCTALFNAALTQDGKTCIITAERGSKFIKVDIPTKKATVLFEHKKGQKGFRCDTGVIQTYTNGKIGASGYFYDEKDQIQCKAIAYIDHSKTGYKIFKKAYDTTKFENIIGNNADFVQWVDADKCFFIGRMTKSKNPKVSEKYKFTEGNKVLCYYDRGKTTILDEAKYFIHFSSGKDKALYTVSNNILESKEGEPIKYENPQTYVIDINKNRIKVNPQEKLYQYLTMSKDGSTAVITEQNLKTTTAFYYYGKESKGFKMLPIDHQEKSSIGQLRLAESGKAYVTFDGFQIIWGELE